MRTRSDRRRSQRALVACESLEKKSCPAAVLSIALAEPVVLESERVACTLTLSEPAVRAERVLVTTAPMTATYGLDFFAPATQQVVFAPGETSQTVFFDTLRDAGTDRAEGKELFRIIATPVTRSLGTKSAIAVIADYVQPPAVKAANVTVVEGNAGTTTASFIVSLTGAFPKPVTVAYATRDGSATVANSDYAPASGTLTFAPGETSKTVGVTVNGDRVLEPDETFQLVLSSPTYARVDQGTATGTITNDEADAPGYQITLNFTNPALPAAQRSVFERAVSRLQEIIVGDVPGVNAAGGLFVDDMLINASVETMSPMLNGYATATQWRPGAGGLPYEGEIHINSSKIGDPGIYHTIIHEMLHALGFADDFFKDAGLVSGLGTTAPLFTGVNAVREYATAFGTTGVAGVPLYGDLTATGSYGSHWDTNTIGTEIMSVGWDTTSTSLRPFSRITAGAMQDLGYQVNYAAADAYTAPAALPDNGRPGTGSIPVLATVPAGSTGSPAASTSPARPATTPAASASTTPSGSTSTSRPIAPASPTVSRPTVQSGRPGGGTASWITQLRPLKTSISATLPLS